MEAEKTSEGDARSLKSQSFRLAVGRIEGRNTAFEVNVRRRGKRRDRIYRTNDDSISLFQEDNSMFKARNFLSILTSHSKRSEESSNANNLTFNSKY